MGYLTARQLSEKWGISERRIIKLCQEERIYGAIKEGRIWNIPEDAMKPSDKRSNIAQYIPTHKRVLVANINTKIGEELIPLLEKEGYIVEGICEENARIKSEKLKALKVLRTDFENQEKLEKMFLKTEKYYDGFIFIDTDKTSKEFMKNKEWLILKLAQKMDCDSSIVLLNHPQNASYGLEKKLAQKLRQRIGLRINSIQLTVPISNHIWMNYDEIAKDIMNLLTGFKNTTGMAITSNGGYLEFDESGRTRELERGIFYRAIQDCLKRLNKESHFWSASMMLEDEWTEEPLEMNFRVVNLETANRGVNMERIFIFRKNEIEKFKKNKTLQIYMQSKIHTIFVDYHEILEKEPELLKIVGNGWDGIDNDTLIVDLPSENGNEGRGYVSRNKREVKKAQECFERLKKYGKDLKEVLK